jgi:hypothetical protein
MVHGANHHVEPAWQAIAKRIQCARMEEPPPPPHGPASSRKSGESERRLSAFISVFLLMS